jgi:hypothetical protein
MLCNAKLFSFYIFLDRVLDRISNDRVLDRISNDRVLDRISNDRVLDRISKKMSVEWCFQMT